MCSAPVPEPYHGGESRATLIVWLLACTDCVTWSSCRTLLSDFRHFAATAANVLRPSLRQHPPPLEQTATGVGTFGRVRDGVGEYHVHHDVRGVHGLGGPVAEAGSEASVHRVQSELADELGHRGVGQLPAAGLGNTRSPSAMSLAAFDDIAAPAPGVPTSPSSCRWGSSTSRRRGRLRFHRTPRTSPLRHPRRRLALRRPRSAEPQRALVIASTLLAPMRERRRSPANSPTGSATCSRPFPHGRRGQRGSRTGAREDMVNL